MFSKMACTAKLQGCHIISMNNKTSDLNNNFTSDGQERRKIEVMLNKLVAINLGKATAGPEEKINEKKRVKW